MRFLDLYTCLKESFNTVDPKIEIDGHDVQVTNHPFNSDTSNTFPEGDEYSELNSLVKALMKYYLSQNKFSGRYLMIRLCPRQHCGREQLVHFRCGLIEP